MSRAPALLLVVDDMAFCTALQRALARRGFDVTTAHTAAEAWRSARNRPPEYAVIEVRDSLARRQAADRGGPKAIDASLLDLESAQRESTAAVGVVDRQLASGIRSLVDGGSAEPEGRAR